MNARVIRLVVALVIAAGLILLPGGGSVAKTTLPSIGLHSIVKHVDVTRFPGEALFLPGGIFVRSTNGAFELWATRLPDGGVDVKQVVRNSGKPSEVRHLPLDPETRFDFGLARFLTLTWSDEAGNQVAQQEVPFCPASWDMTRMNDSGPTAPAYPVFCGSHLTQTTVWGIDAGWAVGALSGAAVEDPGLEDGNYTLRIGIGDEYVKLFGVPAAQRSHTLSVTIFTEENPFPCPPDEPFCFSAARLQHGQSAAGPRANPPKVPAGANGLPDLIPLPAFAIGAVNEEGRDNLVFGANVWNRGPGPLVVEGFRTGDGDVMPATQYFFSKGRITGKAPVGAFHFHDAPDHFHWHFDDFAAYQLLDTDQNTVVTSGKQSFCLAPTDPINMTVPNAQWQPERVGFGSACGFAESVWIREVMPVGWGDTYFQFVSGQSLDITDVPNGEYIVRVVTNASRNLREANYDNNVALRRVVLGGVPGERTAEIV